jgi:hypothetical protein
MYIVLFTIYSHSMYVIAFILTPLIVFPISQSPDWNFSLKVLSNENLGIYQSAFIFSPNSPKTS